MPTKIIRDSNQLEYVIQQLDLNSEEVIVEDMVRIDDSHIYFIDDSHNKFFANEIGSKDYREIRINGDTYRIDNDCFEILLKKGNTTATTFYQMCIKVYAGLHATNILNEMGEKSLAKCYAYIAERRKEHINALSDAERLRTTAKNSVAAANTFDNLVEDIKWFLDNRNEIKAKCK